ncbi:MAG: general secretion pathway protein GspK [Armatimonadetes bacterium]|nr:general secretion pathway protein GspK [Armatimonadota bacterium]
MRRLMVSNHRGIALILTLWVLAALIVLALALGMTARTEVQVSRNYADLIRCRWAARAGVTAALAHVQEIAQLPWVGFEQLDQVLDASEQGIDLGDASFEVRIEDEASKVNVNVVSAATLEALFDNKEIADSIIDWRDKDDIPRAFGAETQYYSSLRVPYSPKNAHFDTVGELMLVKGVMDQIRTDPVTSDGKALIDLLTVYSHSANVSADDKQRVNINTASRDELKAELGDVLTDRDIEAIVRSRDGSSDSSGRSTTRRRKFKSAGELLLVRGIKREKVKQVFDRITVNDKRNLPGLINVNTAPAEVLAAVPGLDRNIAKEIVAYRNANGSFQDVGGLLDLNEITNRAFARASDYLTTRSKVFKIISTGRSANGRSSLVITCVVDLSKGRPQIKYWQE